MAFEGRSERRDIIGPRPRVLHPEIEQVRTYLTRHTGDELFPEVKMVLGLGFSEVDNRFREVSAQYDRLCKLPALIPEWSKSIAGRRVVNVDPGPLTTKEIGYVISSPPLEGEDGPKDNYLFVVTDPILNRNAVLVLEPETDKVEIATSNLAPSKKPLWVGGETVIESIRFFQERYGVRVAYLSSHPDHNDEIDAAVNRTLAYVSYGQYQDPEKEVKDRIDNEVAIYVANMDRHEASRKLVDAAVAEMKRDN